MSDNQEQPLKLLIDDLLRAYGLEQKMNERQLISSWERVAGKMISNHTQDLRFRKGILYIQLDSAPLRQELSYAKDKLITAINSSMKKEIVQDIVLR